MDFVDQVAAIVTSGGLEEIRAVFEHPFLVVPDTVTSSRFQREVEVPAPTGIQTRR